MLSEKAKGKLRAVDPPVEPEIAGPSTESSSRTRDLVIRFSEGHPDLSIAVSEHDSVREIKAAIRDARPNLQDHRLRLIHAGRLLSDKTLVYSWLSTREEHQRQGVASEPDSVGTTWMHCSIGPKLENTEDDEREQMAQLQPARGFDRLASIGFSESDIANFRRQFHSQSASNFLDDREFETEEEYDEHARALEEQWIDSMDSPGTAYLSQTGTPSISVIQGVIAGFFFPLMPLFFMRKQHPPVFWEDGMEHEGPDTVVFSRTMQIGLVVGLLTNLLFGMWRYLLGGP